MEQLVLSDRSQNHKLAHFDVTSLAPLKLNGGTKFDFRERS